MAPAAKSSADALEHALKTAMEQQDNSDIMKFMQANNVKDASAFLLLTSNDFATLMFQTTAADGSINDTYLNQVDQRKLLRLHACYMSIPTPHTRQSWFRITPDTFEDFVLVNNPFGLALVPINYLLLPILQLPLKLLLQQLM